MLSISHDSWKSLEEERCSSISVKYKPWQLEVSHYIPSNCTRFGCFIAFIMAASSRKSFNAIVSSCKWTLKQVCYVRSYFILGVAGKLTHVCFEDLFNIIRIRWISSLKTVQNLVQKYILSQYITLFAGWWV